MSHLEASSRLLGAPRGSLGLFRALWGSLEALRGSLGVHWGSWGVPWEAKAEKAEFQKFPKNGKIAPGPKNEKEKQTCCDIVTQKRGKEP